jgi:hypothetical protein
MTANNEYLSKVYLWMQVFETMLKKFCNIYLIFTKIQFNHPSALKQYMNLYCCCLKELTFSVFCNSRFKYCVTCQHTGSHVLELIYKLKEGLKSATKILPFQNSADLHYDHVYNIVFISWHIALVSVDTFEMLKLALSFVLVALSKCLEITGDGGATVEEVETNLTANILEKWEERIGDLEENMKKLQDENKYLKSEPLSIFTLLSICI